MLAKKDVRNLRLHLAIHEKIYLLWSCHVEGHGGHSSSDGIRRPILHRGGIHRGAVHRDVCGGLATTRLDTSPVTAGPETIWTSCPC